MNLAVCRICLELPGPRGQRGQRGQLVPPVRRVRQVRPVQPELPVQLDRPALLALPDLRGLTAQQGPPGLLVLQEQMVYPGRRAMWDRQERREQVSRIAVSSIQRARTIRMRSLPI